MMAMGNNRNLEDRRGAAAVIMVGVCQGHWGAAGSLVVVTAMI